MSLLDNTKNLRRNQTPEEKLLWQHLRNCQLGGFKIRRQHPISNNYIVDFYCAQKRLVIEIDGEIHLLPEVIAADKIREADILSLGYKIIKFPNIMVRENIGSVLNTILEVLKS